jgi:UDP-N-acetylmuramate dehydrogenase
MLMIGHEIKENVPLAPLTTFRIGGPARYFARITSGEDLAECVSFAKKRKLPLFVLGGGSNILVSDRGFEGLVIQIALRGIETIGETADETVLSASAGEDWDGFVQYCVERGFAGVECLSGIPGLVGGTPVQNVGAYGQEVAESIRHVRVFDRENDGIVTLSNPECTFSYRTSIFNTIATDRYIVLSVTFRLEKNREPLISYRDLRERFADRRPTLTEVRDAVIEIRRAKSMVIDRMDPNSRSAGSFFKNPIVRRDVFEKISSGFDHVPSFEVDSSLVKIPAAWLIENAGFPRGFTRGSAGISSNHTLALINRGNAAAADIIALKDEIEAAVLAKFQISLVPEPIFVGF